MRLCQETRKLPLLILIAAVLFLHGCAVKQASYHYVQKQIEHGDLNFHKRMRVHEYISAFPQDEIVVPEGEDIVLRVDPFSEIQPESENSSLIQIAVKTRMPTKAEMREPINLSFVLDVSGSMGNDNKMHDAKEALVNSIAEMQEGDQISIVTFNEYAHVLVPATRIDRESRKSIVDTVKQIEDGGATNVEDGLVKGYREMAAFRGPGHKRLLLLTDGQSNVETLTPDQIAKKAAVEYQEGARISIIGLGIDVDEPLLRKIAASGSGHYYFAENGRALTKILREELRTTIIPVVKDAVLEIAVSDGFRLLNVYGAEKKPAPGDNKLSLGLGELNVNDWRIIIAEIEGNASPDVHKPISAKLTYSAINGGKDDELRASATVYWHTPPPEGENDKPAIHANVARNSVLFGNAASLVKIGELSETGNYAAALDILDLQINNNKVLQQLDDTGSMDKEIASLNKVRGILIRRIEGVPEPPLVTRSPASNPVPQGVQPQEKASSPFKDLVVSGLSIASKVLPGIWGTVARLFVLAIK